MPKATDSVAPPTPYAALAERPPRPAATIVVGAQQTPDRSKPPVAGPAPSLKLPAIQKLKLSNGI